jgi:3-hydroxymyristoyl/3-hydroxydecanoyl-(acyl carrier protein) dehydratase
MNGLPQVLARREHEDGVDLKLRVDAGCPWFDGHFPGHPILPGVVQIGWATWFAAQWSGRQTPPGVLVRIKFKRPIEPGACLTLRLKAVGARLHYEYLLMLPDGPVSASSGVFDYADEA